MAEEMERTELEAFGEFGLIKHLTNSIKISNPGTLTGVGDDAAVLDFKDKRTLVTSDMLVEGVHFDLSYMPLKHLGYKAAVVNISDICAMNAHATQITVNLGLSNRFSVEAVEELYSGILLAAEKYGVDIVGGDTVSSKSGLLISITALGVADENEIVYRNGAGHNDLIVVSGDLGAAYMGLQILEREKSVFESTKGVQPDLEGHDYILERQLKPEARKDVVEILKALRVKPTSMIDISDGLASEILHICDRGEVGAVIYEEKIPIDPTVINTAADFRMDPTLCALNGGEDYELLFTIAQSDFPKIKGNPHLTVIGHITDREAGVNLVSRDGSQHAITAQGWDAFLKRQIEN